MTSYATLIFSLACLSMGLRVNGYNYMFPFIPLYLLRRALCKIFPMYQSESGLILAMLIIMAVGLFLYALATYVRRSGGRLLNFFKHLYRMDWLYSRDHFVPEGTSFLPA